MKHVAIDLGGRESQICIRRTDGTIEYEGKHPTRTLPEKVKTWEPSVVVLETSAEAFRIADAAKAAGHTVRVVPATMARMLGVGDRGVKTDERDARNLSQASCQMVVPSVHVPSELARELKSICGSREALVEARTMLINNVRGWMRGQLWRIRTGGTSTFPDRVRGHALSNNLTIPEHIERQLKTLEAVIAQTKEADQHVIRIAKQHPVCKRLMTVPGVGPVTAVRFVAAVDDVERFTSAHAVQSYLGLTPGENSSSERQQRTGITKAGAPALRRALTQAAWAAMNVRNTVAPMVLWAKQVAARRGKFIAVVALARKIAGILYALWRDGTTYVPSLSASLPTPTKTSRASRAVAAELSPTI